MAKKYKYKVLNESSIDRFVEKVFAGIGGLVSPIFLKALVRKDPELGKIVKKINRNKNDLDSYIRRTTRGVKLSKAKKKRLAAGDWPF